MFSRFGWKFPLLGAGSGLGGQTCTQTVTIISVACEDNSAGDDIHSSNFALVSPVPFDICLARLTCASWYHIGWIRRFLLISVGLDIIGISWYLLDLTNLLSLGIKSARLTFSSCYLLCRTQPRLFISTVLVSTLSLVYPFVWTRVIG